jgi:hypothetical protein
MSVQPLREIDPACPAEPAPHGAGGKICHDRRLGCDDFRPIERSGNQFAEADDLALNRRLSGPNSRDRRSVRHVLHSLPTDFPLVHSKPRSIARSPAPEPLRNPFRCKYRQFRIQVRPRTGRRRDRPRYRAVTAGVESPKCPGRNWRRRLPPPGRDRRGPSRKARDARCCSTGEHATIPPAAARSRASAGRARGRPSGSGTIVNSTRSRERLRVGVCPGN